jgi:hypothetical protein
MRESNGNGFYWVYDDILIFGVFLCDLEFFWIEDA